MPDQPNLALREYVTSVGFSLQLSKKQIDWLIAIHHFRGDFTALVKWEYATQKSDPAEFMRRTRMFSHSVVSTRSLVGRGLLPAEPGEWHLTKAGHLTVALLKEAGIYQERLKEMGFE